MTAPLPAALTFPHEAPPAERDAVEVAPGVLWLRLPLPFALDHINVWALADSMGGVEGWTVIDSGYGDRRTRELWDSHLARSLHGKPVLRVIATHYHPDHLGNAAWLGERFGCPLWMTQAEFLTGHAAAGEHSGYRIARVIELFAAHGLPGEHLERLVDRGNAYRRGVPEIPLSYRRILPGESMSIGGHGWRAMVGFGHSPEHAALHCANLGVVVSGDMLLPKISTNVSVWPVEPDGNPLALFLDSIARFERLPAATLVLPSHGLPFRGIALRVDQLRAHHEARLGELHSACERPVSAWDVVPLLFRRELDVHQRSFAMGEAIAHLHLLWHDGTLRRVQAPAQPLRFVR